MRKGYTTGVHTSFAFKSALVTFLTQQKLSISKTNKIDNDDLDVTKGCEIVVSISSNKNDLNINSIPHKPYIFHHNNSIEIYAGDGVGVVTKDGLKPPKNYPAINPIPLKALENIFLFCTNQYNLPKLFCSISVTNGQNIAKQTANSKVGILGGISILGTTGWVKPISSTAYINTIETEIIYAKTNNFNTIIFTLGNKAFKEASKNSNNYIIEIGNFIYDGIDLAIKHNISDISLFIGIAKAVKISQGFKNTHNRFGQIDFVQLQNYVSIDISQCITVKRVCELLGNKEKEFIETINHLAQKQLYQWFKKTIKINII